MPDRKEQRKKVEETEREYIEQLLAAVVDGEQLSAEQEQMLQTILENHKEYAEELRQAQIVKSCFRSCEKALWAKFSDVHLREQIAAQWQKSAHTLPFWWKLLPFHFSHYHVAIAAAIAIVTLAYFTGVFSNIRVPFPWTRSVDLVHHLQHDFQNLKANKFSYSVHSNDPNEILQSAFSYGLSYAAFAPSVRAELQGARFCRIHNGYLLCWVYQFRDSPFLVSQFPERFFYRGSVQLDSAVWQTIQQGRRYYRALDERSHLVIWKTDSLICAAIAPLSYGDLKLVFSQKGEEQ